MDTERKWSLKLSGGILFVDISQILDFFRVMLFIAFYNEDVLQLSLTNWLKQVCLVFSTRCST